MIHSIVPKVFENDARKNGVGEKKKDDMIERTQNIPFYDQRFLSEPFLSFLVNASCNFPQN